LLKDTASKIEENLPDYLQEKYHLMSHPEA